MQQIEVNGHKNEKSVERLKVEEADQFRESNLEIVGGPSGTWLVQLVEHVTLNRSVVSVNPTLGLELSEKEEEEEREIGGIPERENRESTNFSEPRDMNFY